MSRKSYQKLIRLISFIFSCTVCVYYVLHDVLRLARLLTDARINEHPNVYRLTTVLKFLAFLAASIFANTLLNLLDVVTHIIFLLYSTPLVLFLLKNYSKDYFTLFYKNRVIVTNQRLGRLMLRI